MEDIWNDSVVYQVAEMARTDCYYRQLLEECGKLEDSYDAILNSLPEYERRVIEEYICTCEELQYRQTQLAYILGLTEHKTKPG